MSLYNLRSADGSWRITKFNSDLDVESSYITSSAECDCPAGFRPSCRHRQMLPKMLAVGAEDSGLFYDFDADQFYEPFASEASSITSEVEPEAVVETEKNDLERWSDIISGQYAKRVESERSDTEIATFIEIHDGVVTPEIEAEIERQLPIESEVMPTGPVSTTQYPETKGSETMATHYPAHPSIGPIKRRI